MRKTLLSALIMGAIWLFGHLLLREAGQGFMLILAPLFLASAMGGWLSLRFLSVKWEVLVHAALLFALGRALYDVPSYASLLFSDAVKQFAVTVVASAAGVFVLPIAETYVAQDGPGISLRKLVVVLLLMAAVIVGVGLVINSTSLYYLGLTVLALGAMIGGSLVGLGLILTLFKQIEWGMWSGSLGISLFLLCTAVWALLASRWFP